MPEEDARIFGDFFNIWKKYREKQMTEADWIDFGKEVEACATIHNYAKNALAYHVGMAIINAMGELYRDGAVPQMADYFGQG